MPDPSNIHPAAHINSFITVFLSCLYMIGFWLVPEQPFLILFFKMQPTFYADPPDT